MAKTKENKAEKEFLEEARAGQGNPLHQLGLDSGGFLSQLGKELVEPAQGIKDVAEAAKDVFGEGGKKKPPPKKPPKPPTAKPLTPAEIEAQIAKNDPFYSVGQALTQEEGQINQPVEQAISGQDTAAANQQATNQALAIAGVSPGSGAAQWLTANLQQANANDQPMAQAMQAYGQAYSAGQQGIGTALGGANQANALGISTAPEQTWLQDLATHIQSNLNYNQEIPSQFAAGPNRLSPAMLYYLKLSGTGGAGGAGVTPLNQINVPGAKNPANTAAIPNVPTSGTGASGLGTINLNDTGSAPG